MSTHLLGSQSFSAFFHQFVLAKLATISTRVNIISPLKGVPFMRSSPVVLLALNFGRGGKFCSSVPADCGKVFDYLPLVLLIN